ncbi:predicted protein [Lichtheimia corymbifera JMRC:FSU:9682]|uniref:Uncharacterized protein n=1 Tax=Lichtheimia corymbifera JMRC:FSU:9682 TaxID=1263082 RepID=A0A068SBK1_9FUNG|nr:predicted protein [Lichtheimia corymbifera JMRC:FSU:9682]
MVFSEIIDIACVYSKYFNGNEKKKKSLFPALGDKWVAVCVAMSILYMPLRVVVVDIIVKPYWSQQQLLLNKK